MNRMSDNLTNACLHLRDGRTLDFEIRTSAKARSLRLKLVCVKAWW